MAEWCGQYYWTMPDFSKYILERLYLKKNGEFFLQCDGDTPTNYVKKSEAYVELVPISKEEAEKWINERLVKIKKLYKGEKKLNDFYGELWKNHYDFHTKYSEYRLDKIAVDRFVEKEKVMA